MEAHCLRASFLISAVSDNVTIRRGATLNTEMCRDSERWVYLQIPISLHIKIGSSGLFAFL